MSPHLVRFPTSSGHMVMVAATGLRDTSCSLDTLKKLTKTVPGHWQILPARCVASWTHLEWAVFHVMESQSSHSSKYRNPELALLSRIAGDEQWEKVLAIAGLKPADKEVVLVWFGTEKEIISKSFQSLIKKWGLKPNTVAWGKDIHPPAHWNGNKESFALETSALTEMN